MTARSFVLIRLTACALATIAFVNARYIRADDSDSSLEDIPLRTTWVDAEDRKSISALEIAFTNQDGETGVLSDLTDRPTLITFFYTRCQNNYKCSAALTRFTALQTMLHQLDLADHVRLLAITYEPDFDDPERLKRFGGDRGMKFTPGAQALRLDAAKHKGFVLALKAPVSFNGSAVNTHGVGLHVLDSRGRLVRQYHTLLWHNDQVIQDVKRLLSEPD
jgi:protein SCO1/2